MPFQLPGLPLTGDEQEVPGSPRKAAAPDTPAAGRADVRRRAAGRRLPRQLGGRDGTEREQDWAEGEGKIGGALGRRG